MATKIFRGPHSDPMGINETKQDRATPLRQPHVGALQLPDQRRRQLSLHRVVHDMVGKPHEPIDIGLDLWPNPHRVR